MWMWHLSVDAPVLLIGGWGYRCMGGWVCGCMGGWVGAWVGAWVGGAIPTRPIIPLGDTRPLPVDHLCN